MQVRIINYELRHRTAVLVLNLEDKFARERRLRGPHPRPFGPLKFYLAGRSAGPDEEPQYFKEPWEMVMQRNPSGYHLFFDLVKSSDGTTRQARLPEGDYLVRVESLYYRPEEKEIAFPGPRDPEKEIDVGKIALPNGFFDLLPGYAYPFPQLNGVPSDNAPTLLRGSIPKVAGLDLTGITVFPEGAAEDKEGYLTYITDEAGQWVLFFQEFKPKELADVTINFKLPSPTITIQLEEVTIKRGHQNSLSPENSKRLEDKLKEALGVPG